MELVYLWVEDYKNIKRQGFNFSPRFECAFKDEYEKNDDGKEILKDNCGLIIKPKEHLKNFFGKDINVTAIVGENGSGKSGILEIIDSIIESKYPGTNFILIIYNEDVLSYFSNIEINTALEKHSDYSLNHYLYLASEQTIENNFFSENFEHFQHRILFNDNLIANMLCNSYISSIQFKLTSFMYIPNRIEVKPILHNFIHDLTTNQEPSFSGFNNTFHQDATDKEEDNHYKAIRNQQFAKEDNLNNLFYESNLDEYHKFLIVWYLREVGYADNDYLLENKKFLIEEFESSDSYLNENDFVKYFQENTIQTNNFTDEAKIIYFKNHQEYFEFDFIDEKDRRYKDLSHGEQTISRIDELYDNFYRALGYEREDVKNFIYCNYLNRDDINKRNHSKLTQDILKQFELINQVK